MTAFEAITAMRTRGTHNIFDSQESAGSAIRGYAKDLLTFGAWRGFCSVAYCPVAVTAQRKTQDLPPPRLKALRKLYKRCGVPFWSTLWVYLRLQK